MIHVCFGLHDKTGRYSKFTGTAMCSIFDNTASAVTVHILHDNTLTQDNREKFIYLAGQYGQLVKFYNVETLCADKTTEIRECFSRVDNTNFTIATFYRIFSPFILSEEIGKVIYLDSDIIVTLDINELWKIDTGDKPLGTVWSYQISLSGVVKAEDYFNAGVLVMNLKALRDKEQAMKTGLKFFAENPGHERWLDQDLLNYCFASQAVKLPLKFNCQVQYHARPIKEVPGRKIYHYLGGREALHLQMNDPFNRLWMKYFIRTPFFDEETIGRLYAGFQQIHVGLKNSMIQLSAVMSGKERAFFTVPQSLDVVKKIFFIRDDEEIIFAENQESLKKLLDAMKNSGGKKVFFIMLMNFPFNLLTQAGFAAGKDFVNGFEFFSEAHGVPLNSYQLIKEM